MEKCLQRFSRLAKKLTKDNIEDTFDAFEEICNNLKGKEQIDGAGCLD